MLWHGFDHFILFKNSIGETKMRGADLRPQLAQAGKMGGTRDWTPALLSFCQHTPFLELMVS
jgi:hypothetical protein